MRPRRRNVIRHRAVMPAVYTRPLVVARTVINRRDFHKLLHQLKHNGIIRIFINIHIACNRDDIRLEIADALDEIRVFLSVFTQMQV